MGTQNPAGTERLTQPVSGPAAATDADTPRPRVMLLKFLRDHYRAVRNMPVDVVSLISRDADKVRDESDGVDMPPYWAGMRGEVEPVWSPSLDEAAAMRIADAIRPLFQRTFVRLPHDDPWWRQSLLDMENRLHIAIHDYHEQLVRLRVDQVWMRSPPHQGTHVVLYAVARELGIPVLMALQSQFSGRFWLTTSIEDLATLETVPGQDLEPLVLPDRPPVPFYMANVETWNPWRSHGDSVREIGKFAGKTFGLSFLYNRKAWMRNLIRVGQPAIRRRMNANASRLHREYDRDVPFIYVPLHLQPELTTDVLGGAYCDQLLMVEELSRRLPEGFVIYVKENPKQDQFMREDSFFTRLAAIPNVRYLPPDVPSLDLIEHSRAVATVTGTAGWEALLLGRSVLLFGQSWYAGLPGVFRWPGPKEDEAERTVQEALAHEGDRDVLARAFADLTRNMHRGVIDEDYVALVEDCDWDAEVRLAAEAFVRAGLTIAGGAYEPAAGLEAEPASGRSPGLTASTM